VGVRVPLLALSCSTENAARREAPSVRRAHGRAYCRWQAKKTSQHVRVLSGFALWPCTAISEQNRSEAHRSNQKSPSWRVIRAGLGPAPTWTNTIGHWLFAVFHQSPFPTSDGCPQTPPLNRGRDPHPALRAALSQRERAHRTPLPLGEGSGVRVIPFAIRDSPFAISFRSPLATRHLSPFAIRHSPSLAIRHSRFFPIHHSPLAARCSPSFSARCTVST
jgi:hypothetical protein